MPPGTKEPRPSLQVGHHLSRPREHPSRERPSLIDATQASTFATTLITKSKSTSALASPKSTSALASPSSVVPADQKVRRFHAAPASSVSTSVAVAVHGVAECALRRELQLCDDRCAALLRELELRETRVSAQAQRNAKAEAKLTKALEARKELQAEVKRLSCLLAEHQMEAARRPSAEELHATARKEVEEELGLVQEELHVARAELKCIREAYADTEQKQHRAGALLTPEEAEALADARAQAAVEAGQTRAEAAIEATQARLEADAADRIEEARVEIEAAMRRELEEARARDRAHQEEWQREADVALEERDRELQEAWRLAEDATEAERKALERVDVLQSQLVVAGAGESWSSGRALA